MTNKIVNVLIMLAGVGVILYTLLNNATNHPLLAQLLLLIGGFLVGWGSYAFHSKKLL